MIFIEAQRCGIGLSAVPLTDVTGAREGLVEVVGIGGHGNK